MDGVVNEVNSSFFEDAMDGVCSWDWHGNFYSCDIFNSSAFWIAKCCSSRARLIVFNGPIAFSKF